VAGHGLAAWPGLAPAMLSPPRRRRVAALRLMRRAGSCGAWPAAGGCWGRGRGRSAADGTEPAETEEQVA
jgi:hypothetical protein